MQPLPIRNPRTGVIEGTFAATDPNEVARRADALRLAQPGFAALSIEERSALLVEWAKNLRLLQTTLLAALVADTGRHRIEEIELQAAIAGIERWARFGPGLLDVREGRSAAVPSVRYRTQRISYALTGVISPWNFPLLLSLIDTVPALLAGSAVLIKPSEVTPRFVEPLLASIRNVPVLSDVLDVILGGGATGAALVDVADIVCFTGSVATGRKVARAAAERLIPVFLELGGKDPLIVLPGSDLDRASDAALRASIQATGQACQSIERVYVHECQHDEFVDRLVAKAQAMELNTPQLRHGHIGPLIFDRQADVIAAQLEDAIKKGAKIACGGNIEHWQGGCWLKPTVLTEVTHAMSIMRDETFGPVIPVMRYGDVDEAVRLANDSEFGLSAAVIGPDEALSLAVAERLEAGAVSVNDAGLTSFVHEAEKQSFKHSGLGGSRMGPSGLERFFRRKAILIQEGAPIPMSLFAENE